ncbi:MAG: hypothetical protein KKB34_10390 [Bacteroidetes bacterium]|nr:hypothetical protein [Bacteroidota bacterium]
MTEVMEKTKPDLSEEKISGTGKLITKQTVNGLVTKFNEINNDLSDIAQFEVDCDDELIQLRDEINKLIGKHKKRQKELRNGLKTIAQKRLIKLGERNLIVTQIQEYGGKIKRLDVTKLLEQG